MADVLMPLRPDEEKMFVGQPKGFPLGTEFDINNVMLPEGDDFGIESEADEIAEEEIATETGFGSVIVVDNIPKVNPEKLEKLMSILNKILSQIGTIKPGGLIMPKDPETNTTLGFAFVEYSSPAEAQAALQAVQGYKLDKSHIFAVSKFDDFDKYARVPDEYAPPEPKEYEPKENLHEWCVDRRGRDQFLCRHMDQTEIYFNDAQRNTPELVYNRANWTDAYVQWSPQGTYMTTLHKQGVAIWGGASFQRLQRFSHPSVQLVQWSPGEKFIITFSKLEPETPRDPSKLVLNVFDVKSGKKLRNFELKPEDLPVHSQNSWPIFKWAGGGQDKYFARLGRGQISVYETPDCGLLDKKSIKLENVQDFSWSPSEPVIAAYQSEQSSGNLPARIVLLQIPEKSELRQKNLFSVSEVLMFWHPQGEYLAVKVDRFTKTRKTTYTTFELFSTKEKDIPMEVLELPNKADKVMDFAWEPKGTRFGMLHGDGNRPSFSLYEMKDMKTHAKGVQLVGTLPKQQANAIRWSPQGKYLVLAGFKSLGLTYSSGLNGHLEFVAAEDLEVLSAAEHFMASAIEWDPTGRYIATAVVNEAMENGVTFWQFNGQEIVRFAREKLFQFQWRPRPPTRLSKAQEEDINKNLRKYSRRYEEEDAKVMNQVMLRQKCSCSLPVSFCLEYGKRACAMVTIPSQRSDNFNFFSSHGKVSSSCSTGFLHRLSNKRNSIKDLYQSGQLCKDRSGFFGMERFQKGMRIRPNN